jgi:transposase
MHKYIWVGLDVHKATIAVAVAKGEDAPRSLGTIPNTPDAIAKLMRKLGPLARLRVCYEAGPCGYVLYRQLAAMGVHCIVVAPTLVPVRAGDRVKTDRRDALKLARLLRSGELTGELTAVAVPDEAHEALRDLVRAREAAHKDLRRARHRLQKFLLRQGHRCPLRTKAWGTRYLAWVRGLGFAHAAQGVVHGEYLAEVERLAQRRARLDRELELAFAQSPAALQHVGRALQVLRGVAFVTAVTAVAEVGQFGRFSRARPLMAYSGLVPREASSGDTGWRGAITKTGNAHLRRGLIEAAWQDRHRPRASRPLRPRRRGQAAALCALAEQAEPRVHLRYRRLLARGKSKGKAVTASGRELLGFMWAVAVHAETGSTLPAAA